MLNHTHSLTHSVIVPSALQQHIYEMIFSLLLLTRHLCQFFMNHFKTHLFNQYTPTVCTMPSSCLQHFESVFFIIIIIIIVVVVVISNVSIKCLL